MIAKCDYCPNKFDTKRGGFRCPWCGTIVCDVCESSKTEKIEVLVDGKRSDGIKCGRCKRVMPV